MFGLVQVRKEHITGDELAGLDNEAQRSHLAVCCDLHADAHECVRNTAFVICPCLHVLQVKFASLVRNHSAFVEASSTTIGTSISCYNGNSRRFGTGLSRICVSLKRQNPCAGTSSRTQKKCLAGSSAIAKSCCRLNTVLSGGVDAAARISA
jgi:hypothetical protein